MSWDLIVFAKDTPTRSDEKGLASFEDGWEATDIGTLEEVPREISRAFPETNWSDPTWGLLAGDSFSLEFSLGRKEPVNTFSIHARGSATDAVLHMISVTGWKVLDVQTTQWLNDAEDPDRGRRLFQNFLDTVIEEHHAPPEKKGVFSRLFGR